jgi:hypothetical protein
MSGQKVEFHFPGVPVYQLKAKDISETGAEALSGRIQNF